MSTVTAPAVQVVAVDTAALADRSYLVHDGSSAFVLDPQRDIDRVFTESGMLGLVVKHMFETHLHNDYVTGGLALARATGTAYHVNGADHVAFDRAGIAGRRDRGQPVNAGAGAGYPWPHLYQRLVRASRTRHRNVCRG